MIFCTGLHFSFNSEKKMEPKCHPIAWEVGTRVKWKSGYLIPSKREIDPPSPCKSGWLKHDFPMQISIFHAIPSKIKRNIFGTWPLPPSQWVVGLKHNFSVQIWTFHFIPSKNTFFLNQPQPLISPFWLGAERCDFQIWTFCAIPSENWG